VPAGTRFATGREALLEAAGHADADVVVNALVGSAGLLPTLTALDAGKTVALANKESLIAGGSLVTRRVVDAPDRLLPVDSEHSAIFQCLAGNRLDDVRRVILTASGGPFRTWTREQIENATIEQALKHPNWSMGRKITIDSASMFNKGLEIIEAYHLFDLEPDQIEVLVHPQSIIHGLVEFSDCSVIAQMGAPDMRTPIAHCLAWPERIDGPAKKLDLAAIGQLTFEAPDPVRFPSLRLVQEALRAGGAMPTVFNAANEVAVATFLERRMRCPEISRLVESALDKNGRSGPQSIEDVFEIDREVRRSVTAFIEERCA